MKRKGILKKILGTFAALAVTAGVVSGSAVSVKAEEVSETTATGSNGATTGTATVTIKSNTPGSITITLPTAYTGEGTAQNFNYKVYKVFDATVDTESTAGTKPTAYTYALSNNKTDVPSMNTEHPDQTNHFIKDDANNIYYGTEHDTQVENSTEVTINGTKKYIVSKTDALSSDEAQAANTAIRTYLNLSDDISTNDIGLVANVNVANTFSTLVIQGLGYGYFYLTTNAGSAIALTSTNPDAVIESKNDVPSIDKKITAIDDDAASLPAAKGSVTEDGKKGIAELGSTVHYQSIIHVKPGASNYVFKDLMDNTLSLDKTSIKVQSKVGTVAAADVNATDGNTTNYTLADTPSTDKNDQYTFKIEFDDSLINKLAGQKTADNDVQLIVTYSAKVINGELQTAPGKNSATISYGSDKTNLHTSDPSRTEVYTAKLKVEKHIDNNGSAGAALANAKFVLKNASGQYYKYTAATTGDNAQPAKVEWVTVDTNTKEDSEGFANQVTVLTSDSNGNVKSDILDGFTGLSNGTYTLHEIAAPAGYNKAEDSTFTVKGATEENAFEASGENTNLIQTKDVLDKAGSVLPSTGGIGTTIFYAAGIVLIAGAAVLLITRRKKNA